MVETSFDKLFSNNTAMVAVIAAMALLFTFAGQAAAQKTKPATKTTPAATKQKPAATAATASQSVNHSKCTGNGLTTDEVNEIVAIHTFDRAAHGLGALKWDCTLANYAQAWANKGEFAHREDTNYGENLFVSSNGDEDIRSAMDRWLAEKAFWTNKTGTCAAGKTCTHFTQMVWRKTTKIGCGINRNATGKWKVLLVCNYDPTGNTGGPAF